VSDRNGCGKHPRGERSLRLSVVEAYRGNLARNAAANPGRRPTGACDKKAGVRGAVTRGDR
jgi:hypothetical protein